MLASLALVVAWLSPVAAELRLGQHAALQWVHRDGTEACIGERDLADAVTLRLGERPAKTLAANQLRIEGEIEKLPRGGGWKATLRTSSATGEQLGQRELREPSADCHALDDKLVLVIALIVDPDLLSEPPAASIAVPPATPSIAKALPVPPARHEPWRLAAGVSGLVARGILPGYGLGIEVAASFEPPHVWPFEVSGTLWPRDRGLSGPGGATFLLATLGGALCPPLVSRRWASACVGAQAGQIRAAGFGFDRNEKQTDAIFDVTAELRFDWQVTSSLVGRFGIGTWVPVSRPRFVFSQAGQDVLVYQPAVASIVTQVAVWARF